MNKCSLISYQLYKCLRKILLSLYQVVGSQDTGWETRTVFLALGLDLAYIGPVMVGQPMTDLCSYFNFSNK